MELRLNELFPAAGEFQWHFIEYTGNQSVPFKVRIQTQGDARSIELEAPAGHRFTGFFDRMTVRESGLELNRLRIGQYVINIQPPLVITPGPEQNRVDDLFSGSSIEFPIPDAAPYAGRAGSKKFTEVALPGSPFKVPQWEVKVAAVGRHGTNLFRATFQFLGGIGLVSYIGDVFGVYFVYKRTDVTVPTPPPQPPPQVGVNTQTLLSLHGSRQWSFQLRGNTTNRATLRCVARPGGVFDFEGPHFLLASLLADSNGIRLAQLRVWQKALAVSNPALIATRILDLTSRRSFDVPAVSVVSLATPDGRTVKTVSLQCHWSSDVGLAPWAGPPPAPYHPWDVRYLHLRLNLEAADGRPIPAYEEVLALHEGAGPVMIAIRSGDAAPSYWDLTEYPNPLP